MNDEFILFIVSIEFFREFPHGIATENLRIEISILSLKIHNLYYSLHLITTVISKMQF